MEKNRHSNLPSRPNQEVSNFLKQLLLVYLPKYFPVSQRAALVVLYFLYRWIDSSLKISDSHRKIRDKSFVLNSTSKLVQYCQKTSIRQLVRLCTCYFYADISSSSCYLHMENINGQLNNRQKIFIVVDTNDSNQVIRLIIILVL